MRAQLSAARRTPSSSNCRRDRQNWRYRCDRHEGDQDSVEAAHPGTVTCGRVEPVGVSVAIHLLHSTMRPSGWRSVGIRRYAVAEWLGGHKLWEEPLGSSLMRPLLPLRGTGLRVLPHDRPDQHSRRPAFEGIGRARIDRLEDPGRLARHELVVARDRNEPDAVCVRLGVPHLHNPQ